MPGSTTNMGLVTWNQLTDFFSHTDLVNNWTKVDAHDHIPVSSGGQGGVPIPGGGIQNGAIINAKLAVDAVATSNIQAGAVTTAKLASGSVTSDKLAAAHGSISIVTTEATTSSSYTTLTTPDQVPVTLTGDSLLFVGYRATWNSTSAVAGRAAIFLGANQVTLASASGGAPQAQEAAGPSSNLTDSFLTSFWGGLYAASPGSSAYTGDITTGQVLGVGPSSGLSTTAAGGMAIMAAPAGTYNLAVKFRVITGTLTVKNRHLWVYAVNF